ncbi:hypothetical protein [Thermoplasma volcanium GSS1]|uniref:Lipid/polyisoprenoid-binding YceI-like domain-containing protein n=1 Tax=Thermoplasma volcanium (strain ATCC 51530 / DSM 4299 / JCM 9571 / NBRC 15438 / GSS1) TaxID=273116 RepID=Q97C92_THEVO|nr:YceI family protein [Thermoplasma volcanium]BAB59353.1 hypothetical protein [Thermoplasma volcanium GSS1]
MEVLKKWTPDKAHSSIEFVVRHMMVSKVRGSFNDFDIVFIGDPDDLAQGKAEATVRVASITTGEADRDQHLRSQDFFYVEKFPEIKFSSTDIMKAGDGYKINGKLTIKDVTKDVSFEGELEGKIKDPYGKQRFGFTARTVIDRRDFGLMWNMALDNGGILVGNTVNVEISLEMVEAQ